MSLICEGVCVCLGGRKREREVEIKLEKFPKPASLIDILVILYWHMATRLVFVH